jgi:hypothetical protein
LKSNQENSDWFDAYLRNELSEADKLSFELKLKEDTAFNESFQIHAILVKGIEVEGRKELKNFLKENTVINYWGQNFWSKTMRYASVAVFLFFAGLYALVHFYLQPKTQNNIAIVSEKETISPKTEPNETELKESEQTPPQPPTINELAIEDTEIDEITSSNENIGLTLQEESLDKDGYNDDEQMMPEPSSEQAKKTSDYYVLKEIKLSDTLLLAVHVVKKIDYSNTDNLYKPKTLSKSPTLPRNVQNSNLETSGVNKNRQVSNDSASVSKTEVKETKTNVKIIEAQPKYQVEFWTSPINFKGYKFVNKTIQLYGLGTTNVQLKTYNNQLYLIHQKNVYPLSQCIDGCVYKPLNDDEIEALLLDN